MLAVLHVQHPGSDRDTLREGLRALRAAASGERLVARVGDVAFVLDETARRARSGSPWAQLRADARNDARQAFGGVARPFLSLTGSLDADPLAGRGQQRDDGHYRTQVYEGMPTGAKALLWLEGADHASFGGGTGMSAQASRRRDAAVLAAEPAHQALIAGLTALWWRWRLSNDAAAEAALRALATGQTAAGLAPVVAPDRFVLG